MAVKVHETGYGKWKVPVIIIAVIVVLSLAGTGILLSDSLGVSIEEGSKRIEVAEGDGTSSVAKLLKDNGIIKYPLLFKVQSKIGEGYGLKTYTCRTIQELVDALEDAKKQEIACLFDLKVIPKTMTDGYESWWDVGIATTSEKESVRKACEGVMKGREEARLY